VLLVGEQSGDQEDVTGEPFAGPAGRLLDKLLDAAGIDRKSVYLTNAMQHFSFRPDERGKRRIHQTPRRGQVRACLPWLTGELRTVRPELVVCLGTTAAKALLGPAFRLIGSRGELLDHPGDLPGAWRVLATVHPLSVLRVPDRDRACVDLLADLNVAAKYLAA
jgi:DNA polymerase